MAKFHAKLSVCLPALNALLTPLFSHRTFLHCHRGLNVSTSGCFKWQNWKFIRTLPIQTLYFKMKVETKVGKEWDWSPSEGGHCPLPRTLPRPLPPCLPHTASRRSAPMAEWPSPLGPTARPSSVSSGGFCEHQGGGRAPSCLHLLKDSWGWSQTRVSSVRPQQALQFPVSHPSQPPPSASSDIPFFLTLPPPLCRPAVWRSPCSICVWSFCPGQWGPPVILGSEAAATGKLVPSLQGASRTAGCGEVVILALPSHPGAQVWGRGRCSSQDPPLPQVPFRTNLPPAGQPAFSKAGDSVCAA